MNTDGTYDIEYDDGDTERRVRKSLVRKVGGDSKRKSKSKYDDTEDDNEISRGDRVEARYRGKSKWYKGKITRVNSDDTYDIEYDDGDTERRVKDLMYAR